MIKAATIGAGRRGASIHCPAIKRLKDVELVAACDLDEDLLREKAVQFEIRGSSRITRKCSSPWI